MIRTLSLILAVVAWLMPAPGAHADFTFTQGTGETAFDFTCFTSKHCFASVPITSAGTELFTSGNAGYVRFPSAQAVTQSGVWTVQPGNTANTVPWLMSLPSASVASGAYASGSIASGAMVDLGSQADAAWSSGSGSLIAIAKTIAGNTGAAIPAGSNIIGNFRIDQTTAGTTNGVVINAGANAIGNVGGFGFQLAPTITVQNAAYSAGNSEGGLITVTGAARTVGGTGILDGIRLKSTGGSTNTVWVYAWSKTPVSTCTDKSAFVSSTSDQPYAIPGFPTSVVLGGAPGAWDTSTYAQLTSMVGNFKNQDTSPGTAIYVCLVTAGSVTPAATSDLSIVLGGIQN